MCLTGSSLAYMKKTSSTYKFCCAVILNPIPYQNASELLKKKFLIDWISIIGTPSLIWWMGGANKRVNIKPIKKNPAGEGKMEKGKVTKNKANKKKQKQKQKKTAKRNPTR